jgi:hypothetical protein
MPFSGKISYDRLIIIMLLVYIIYQRQVERPSIDFSAAMQEIAMRDSTISFQRKALASYGTARDSIAQHYEDTTPNLATDSAVLAFFADRYSQYFNAHQSTAPDSLRSAPVR